MKSYNFNEKKTPKRVQSGPLKSKEYHRQAFSQLFLAYLLKLHLVVWLCSKFPFLFMSSMKAKTGKQQRLQGQSSHFRNRRVAQKPQNRASNNDNRMTLFKLNKLRRRWGGGGLQAAYRGSSKASNRSRV